MFIGNKYIKNNVTTYKGDEIIIQVIFQTVLFNKLIFLTSYIFGTDLFNLYIYVPERRDTVKKHSIIFSFKHYMMYTVQKVGNWK